jgi:nucleotide-binding universal stress UspA family protein
MITTKNLLVPVDLGDASSLIVQKAGELAQELPARIVLLHIVEPAAARAAWCSRLRGP